ncbi:B3 domain-containing protein At3g19184-like [Trifolium pratense]|uniref:B3 domain-containing protein At3g19184-like n=1 Tax=Trifolium pratense TaxID=57577 RepID=UPI001E694634|nr:B3 domain-containing protein At3g19184-like [Trifolium pratense]
MVAAAAAASYEESRRKRMEENKKRMEALNLHQLSQSLHKSSSSAVSKPSPSKPRTRTIHKELVVVRRSSRVANLPTPIYKEVLIDLPRNRISRGGYNKYRDYSKRVYASDEAREEALEKAEKLQSDLDSDHPIFIKSMLQSHVTGGFWLGLPVHFCKEHLPKHDEEMTLIDEDGEESRTTYLAKKTGLSGGWRGFAIAHNLVDGDALIFELVKRTAFKVYIIRVNGPSEGKQLE